jgi:steroid 5-alpha reductase family enzyme
MAWTLQGLWVTFTFAAALAAITSRTRQELGWVALIGFLIWLFGFAFEVIADNQKSRFRKTRPTKGSLSKAACGPNRATPTTLAKSCFGSALPSLPSLCCKAGNG